MRADTSAWATFPSDAAPRPLVLLDGRVVAPSAGFATSEQKLAFLGGDIKFPGSFPSAAPTADGYPIIDAATAFSYLRLNASGTAPSRGLSVSGMAMGLARFSTDRGAQQLPAWLVSFDGVTGSAAILAVDRRVVWPVGDPVADRHSAITAQGALGDSTLRVSVIGGEPPCGYEPHVVATEYAHDVVLDVANPVAPSHPSTTSSGPPRACTAIGHSWTVVVDLQRPLGGRVLIDGASRAPIAVTSS